MSTVATEILVSVSPTKLAHANASDDTTNDEGIIVDLEEKPDKLTLASIVLANGNDIKYTRLQELYHERFGHDLSCRRLCAALGITDHIRNPILALRSGGGGLFEIRLLSADFTIHVSEKAMLSDDGCFLNATLSNSATTTATTTTTTNGGGAQLSPSVFDGLNLSNTGPDAGQTEPNSAGEPKLTAGEPTTPTKLTTVKERTEPTTSTAATTATLIEQTLAVVSDGTSSLSRSSSSTSSYSSVVVGGQTVRQFAGVETVPTDLNPTAKDDAPPAGGKRSAVDQPTGDQPTVSLSSYSAPPKTGVAARTNKNKPSGKVAAYLDDDCSEAFATVRTSSPFTGVDRLRFRLVNDGKAVFDCCKKSPREHNAKSTALYSHEKTV